MTGFHGTTVLSVRRGGTVVVGGDGDLPKLSSCDVHEHDAPESAVCADDADDEEDLSQIDSLDLRVLRTRTISRCDPRRRPTEAAVRTCECAMEHSLLRSVILMRRNWKASLPTVLSNRPRKTGVSAKANMKWDWKPFPTIWKDKPYGNRHTKRK